MRGRAAGGVVLGVVLSLPAIGRAQASKADEELLKAAKKGDLPKIEALLGSGANVNARNKDGRTPVIEATREGKLPAVKALLDKGASPDVADKDARTALVEACKRGKGDIA